MPNVAASVRARCLVLAEHTLRRRAETRRDEADDDVPRSAQAAAVPATT